MWIDITMPLHKNMPIWPGDTPFSYKQDATLTKDGANVGQITMSLHAGTHVDAPYHYDDFGKAIDALPLELFIGGVKIVDVVGVTCVRLEHVENLEVDNVERMFFKTKAVHDVYRFDDDFSTIAPEVIHFLANKGVCVVGTDAPSVDALEDVSLSTHHACKREGMYIIENLFLKDVDAGMYEFIGLPLAIQGGDASPIRAVVRKTK